MAPIAGEWGAISGDCEIASNNQHRFPGIMDRQAVPYLDVHRGKPARFLPALGILAGGASLQVVDTLSSWAPLLLLLGVIVLVVTALTWKGMKASRRTLALLLGLVFIGLGLLPALQAPIGAPPGGPPGAYVPKFEIILQTTRSTARDVASEIFDTQGGTGGGGETPTATLCAYGTNAEVDLANKVLRHAVTVDDDAATSAAAFSAPDICSVDFSFRLLNPVDANGDGVMDAVTIFWRLRSSGVTETEDGNGTSTRRNLFMRDNTFGWYVGVSRDVDTINTDGQWVSVAPAGIDDTKLASSYAFSNLGTNAGADEDYATFAWIFRNYGPYGFTQPLIGYTYTMLVDIGTDTSFTTITIFTFLSARA